MGKRVFQIGNIDYDKKFLETIINILEYGFKYIPCFNNSNFHIFKNVFTNIENEIFNFNKQIFFNNLYDNSSIDDTSIEEFSQDESTPVSSDCVDAFFLNKNKLSRKKRNENLRIPILEDTIVFELELLKSLNDVKLKNSKNLLDSELKVLKEFTKLKPFKVVELDKNVGSAILSNELHENLILNILGDTLVYRELEYDPLECCLLNIKDTLFENFENKNISKKLFNSLINPNGKLGSFRILPKVHKSKFSCRPIINYKEHITCNLCLFLDCICRPFVKSTESYILDSQNLIQKLVNRVFPRDSNLLTGDFEALYSNINHDDCLLKCTDFLNGKINSEHFNINGFHNILKLVLKNNYFSYNNKYFEQKLGIAMGSICGPTIANLYVSIYEIKWTTIYRPLAYYRFIDDVFLVVHGADISESLKNAFGSLKLNLVAGKRQVFLDLELELNQFTCKINFYAHFKPTNTFSYLYIFSNHPSHIFKNLIKALFIRMRRICSYFSDYIYFASILSFRLLERGFEKILIDKAFMMVADLERDNILQYKNKEKKLDFNKTLIFRHQFDKNILNFKNVVNSAFDSFKLIKPKYKDFKIFLVNKMQSNLSALLIHNLKFPFIFKNSFKKCKNSKCDTCIYSNNSHYIYLTNNFILPIFDNSTCGSKNIIYLIFCSFCSTFYIGQSNDVKKRIYNHIYDIKKFVSYSDFKSVAVHFNLKHHNFKNHFSFFVIKKDVNDLEARLNIESVLLNLCKKLGVNLMNDHIPLIKNFYVF